MLILLTRDEYLKEHETQPILRKSSPHLSKLSRPELQQVDERERELLGGGPPLPGAKRLCKRSAQPGTCPRTFLTTTIITYMACPADDSSLKLQ